MSWLDRLPQRPTPEECQAITDAGDDRLRVCTDQEFRAWMESAR